MLSLGSVERAFSVNRLEGQSTIISRSYTLQNDTKSIVRMLTEGLSRSNIGSDQDHRASKARTAPDQLHLLSELGCAEYVVGLDVVS